MPAAVPAHQPNVLAWYTRLGYRPVSSHTMDHDLRLAPLLATPCDLVVYHKDLISP